MGFDSLEQRLAHGYLTLLPAFTPDLEAEVTPAEQEDFYRLIRSLYQLAYDEPQLFVTQPHPDDAYPGRSTKKAYGKPALTGYIQKFVKALSTTLQSLYDLGQGEPVKLTRRQQEIFTRLGLDVEAPPAPAWRWMATRPGANILAFSYCLFRQDHAYTPDLYAGLFPDPAVFRRLETWMLDRGYRAFDIQNTTASACKLSLSYVNPAWSPDRPSGGFEYKIKHTGISFRYDIEMEKPLIFGLCIPGGMKPWLEAFDAMDGSLRDFVVNRTKKCDNCRYCVQTDKTGKRPLACIPITHQGKHYALCPYYPGYNYAWAELTDDVAGQLMAMLAFMDERRPGAQHR